VLTGNALCLRTKTLFSLHFSFFWLGADKPKTEDVAHAVREVEAPTRGTRARRNAVPTPAAYHTVKPRDSPGRICLCSTRIVPVPVPAPFKHVPVHIVQAKRVGGFFPYTAITENTEKDEYFIIPL